MTKLLYQWLHGEHFGLGLENYREQRTTEPSIPVVWQVTCEECSRTFRRESDKKRHKCSSERRKPVWEQKGAVQCAVSEARED